MVHCVEAHPPPTLAWLKEQAERPGGDARSELKGMGKMIKRLSTAAVGALLCLSALFTSAAPAKASEDFTDPTAPDAGAKPDNLCLIFYGICN